MPTPSAHPARRRGIICGVGGRRAALAAVVVVAALAPAGTAAAYPSADPGIHWESYLPDMPPLDGPQPHAVPGCRRATIRCIDTEVRKLRRAQKRFGCDHRGVFATTYLELTKVLRRRARQRPSFFRFPKYLYVEDALFADVYFRTLRRADRGEAVPPAWQIAFDTARDGQVNAAQDMLLGINAHVQNDMPFVLAALGLTTRDGRSRKPDHDAVNEVLDEAYAPVVHAVADRFDPFVATTNADWDPLDDIAGLEMVRVWRELVWRNAERLIEARDAGERAQVADQIRQQAALWAQGIAAPQQPGYRATRDAYCAQKLANQR